MEKDLYIEFQKLLDFALATDSVDKVLENLINAAVTGWSNKKVIHPPYIKMS